ncbi:GDP-fucose protein O-fucosyltransferase 1-like [Xenia sp. Carnegie-2017]|uniref:GDP-fucose protein O-fucosyltransferase 1-like n=1 Tax=Xenia sp. Carnegie-2017 TaxID=2897299 RepID=UPI001F03AF9B|nr:GDP-fucose protein O-fucosyltransferase 1-like [Xenia sp. Carnegie-2017]
MKTFILAICLANFACSAEKKNRDIPIQDKNKWDKNGFIVYCPCMGRFGNQASQFLGALAFAKGLNRTLVLPPWITYEDAVAGSERTPFDRWFKVKPLQVYHRVVTMEKFMVNIAPSIWPKGTRTGFCYLFRNGNQCAMKEGNPFGPFWDHFNVDFDNYVEHKGLLYETDFEPVKNDWILRFPSFEYPVIALMGAPGDFPELERNRRLQKYLQWSDHINKLSDKFIQNVLPPGSFVGIHLRTGSDWKNACNHIGSTKKLFASEQCTGYNHEYKLTKDMCWPSKKDIAIKTRKMVKQYNASSVFIATDDDAYTTVIEKELKKLKRIVTVHQQSNLQSRDAPIIDLAILTKSTLFLGNCVSSFSSFVKRTRDSEGKVSGFWNFDPRTSPKTNPKNDEL